MYLTKIVPAHRVMLKATWCNREFLAMSPSYRAIRGKMKKPMDKCYWCKHPFADGEMMALACFVEKGNQVLCQGCAEQLFASAEFVPPHPYSPFTTREGFTACRHCLALPAHEVHHVPPENPPPVANISPI